MQIQFDTRDIKKRSSAPTTTHKSNGAFGGNYADRTIDDEKFEHHEVNTEPGKILERVRNECGLTRKDLATRLAIKEGQIAKWENGQEQLPGPMKTRIQNILGKKLK